MAEYHYDESGNMAVYFLLTFLLVILVPLTLSSPASFRRKQGKDGCPCQQCVDHRANLQQGFLNPKARRRTIILLVGWTFSAFLAYRVASAKIENKVYNPFEILGISSGTTVKDIKSHYKKLSKKFHPDKVKLGMNDTIEAVQAKFVEITKAYKSLTDETIRENLERYGHPDGRQEVSMAYGVIFGAMLPALVGRWWFGNREKTKDGVNARSAAAFFKSLTEESGIDEVVGTLGKSFEWERSQLKSKAAELDELESRIKAKLGSKWATLKQFAEVGKEQYETRRRAFILLYAHLLRLSISSSSLRAEQSNILLQTPTLLNSLLNISISRNWLVPTLAVMRLHAYLAQALIPGESSLRYAQLPGISESEAEVLSRETNALQDLVQTLEEKGDGRVGEIKKAVSKWGKLEIVDASFKVIGERIVTPLSIVYLVVKLRISPPTAEVSAKPVGAPKNGNDEEFLISRKDAEDMPEGAHDGGWAHAPHWPANRKPGWWIVLADPKSLRVIVPPMKVTDVPIADPSSSRDYRSYKLQFQAPQNVQSFPWRLHLVSDTFVEEEATQDITLTISQPEQEQEAEDEISDPEEDSLAGQMAMMRGGTVKKRQDGDDESDDESSTDDDRKENEDSSDSDSD
ncbi:hypothetical protein EW026_g3617 [Hermanssonia centrifuga]|uniref:J domain-containing protein n=1 Tax=Hermanssonia centrifuga TaxID=98765 RepID=A0A4V3XAL9_9APHY|nr:hypothetical protein EW026_g3617 [Hermanssonia centrifuga]